MCRSIPLHPKRRSPPRRRLRERTINPEKPGKLKVVFSKTGDMKFISHLDMVRLFQRASRRARLPVVVTQGFSPRLKISITKALKLGLEGIDQEAVFYIKGPFAPGEFMSAMNSSLPDGVKITRVEEII